jgi:hypothetical protein
VEHIEKYAPLIKYLSISLFPLVIVSVSKPDYVERMPFPPKDYVEKMPFKSLTPKGESKKSKKKKKKRCKRREETVSSLSMLLLSIYLSIILLKQLTTNGQD